MIDITLLDELYNDELYGQYEAAKRQCFALSSSHGYSGNVNDEVYRKAKDLRDRAMVLLFERGVRV